MAVTSVNRADQSRASVCNCLIADRWRDAPHQARVGNDPQESPTFDRSDVEGMRNRQADVEVVRPLTIEPCLKLLDCRYVRHRLRYRVYALERRTGMGLSTVHCQPESGGSPRCRCYRNLCGLADDNRIGTIPLHERVESAHATRLLVSNADNS